LTFDESTFSVTGDILASGEVTAYSDESLKTNIQTISEPLEIVTKLRGVTYFRTDLGETSAGVIAQEVEPVMPMLVKTNLDGLLSVNYNGFSGLFIECIKELTQEITELKKELAKLKSKLGPYQ